MPTFSADFQALRDAFGRRLQFLVELDVDRCAQTYAEGGTGNCQASDLGDGSRCYYTFSTCQDPDNFSKGTRTFRFCLNDVPWHTTADAVWPLLKRIVGAPQRVEDDSLTIFPERIRAEFHFDWTPPPLDHDKGAGAFNTGTAGEFWRLLQARHRNLVGTAKLRLRYGFSDSTISLAEFVQIGPDYDVSGFNVGKDGVSITGTSPLIKLNERKVPFEISDDNLIQADMTAGQTTMTVLDASEYPDPDDYERVEVVLAIEDSTVEYVVCTNRNTSTNVLTITRGQWGTSGNTHTAANNIKVSHVLTCGVNNGSSAATAYEPTEFLQDLLEWSGAVTYDAGGETATGVDTASFDAVRDGYWPDKSILATFSKSTKVIEIMREVRAPRSIMVFVDADGDFACEALAPGMATLDLTEESLVSVSSDVDQEERVTRAELRYDPASDDADNPDDFNKIVVLVDSDLEGENNFAKPKEGEQILERFLDPAAALADVRNILQRYINRRAFGLRRFKFQLEFKEASQIGIGDHVTIQSKAVQEPGGAESSRNCIIIAKENRSQSVFEFEAVDTSYGRSFARIAPDTATEAYASATDAERGQGYYWSDANGRVGSLNYFGDVFF